jgi:hypothetical protein
VDFLQYKNEFHKLSISGNFFIIDKTEYRKMTTRSSTTSHSEWSTAPDKSFVSTKAFNLEFYQYSVSRSKIPPYIITGVLVLHASATPSQCPAGRVLHANGKRLFPDVNVMNSFTTPPGATIQAKKFMLGVYDPESMLNGFIDPTSATFAVYDKNRPASDYLLNATAGASEATSLLGLGGQGSRVAAKIIVGNSVSAVAANDTPKTVAAGDSSVGQFTSSVASLPNAVTTVLATVTTSSLTANSLVFLTAGIQGPYVLSVGTIIPEISFIVNITNVSGAAPLTIPSLPVNWLIIN